MAVLRHCVFDPLLRRTIAFGGERSQIYKKIDRKGMAHSTIDPWIVRCTAWRKHVRRPWWGEGY